MKVMIKILLTGEVKVHSQKAFSLVELLVVLTIMSIIVGSISFVMFNKKDTLKTYTTKIVQNMKLVQQRAIRENRQFQVEVDFSNNSFYFIDETVNLPEDVSITIKTAERQLIEKDLVAITFYADASSSGGVVALESENELIEIILTWISGKITTKHHVKPV